MGTPVSVNVADLKTTIPGLWSAIMAVALDLGVQLPGLPTWVTPLISAIGVAFGVYLTLFVKSHQPAPVAETPAE